MPPAVGIVHQVNLEYLAKGVFLRNDAQGQVAVPDTLVGTDSHTTMINGLGVLGWGVGGIEAEAVMLGQPLYMLMPEVVGFEITGELPAGTTATDLVLTVTQILRKAGVVNKFVEFFGPGVSHMKLADRATIGNMAPEYGATMGFFPVDDETLGFLRRTGRTRGRSAAGRALCQGAAPVPQPTAARCRSSPEACRSIWARSSRAWPGPSGRKTGCRCESMKESFRKAPCARRSPSAAFALDEPALHRTGHVADNGHSARYRPRRRGDRRHHQLHQHQQPVGDGRRRPAGQEGGRARPEGQAVREDQPGSRLARGDRLSRQVRPDA